MTDSGMMIVERETLHQMYEQGKYEGALEALQALGDVVEVVRCKDCKHRGDDLCPMYHGEEIEWDDDGYIENEIVIYDYTEDNAFCSNGERKTNE